METPIIAALIALSGVITAPFINHHLAGRREGAKFNSLSEARRVALRGQWVGKAIQSKKDGGEIVSTIKIEIATNSKLVKGTGEIRHKKQSEEIVEEFVLVGGFFADKFARFTFDDKDTAKIQPGSMMLILTDDPKIMNGLYIGYGSENRDLGMGKIELRKAS
jgi:hypothetical protein